MSDATAAEEMVWPFNTPDIDLTKIEFEPRTEAAEETDNGDPCVLCGEICGSGCYNHNDEW